MSPHHPIQPIENVDGVARFKPNKIVQYLLKSGPYELGGLEYLNFSNEDREQFAQLLGMSVADYVELPYVSERSSHEAQLAEDELNPSNPYAYELSWVDETNASCESEQHEACTTTPCKLCKRCWFCFGTGQNSKSDYVNGVLDIAGVPCALCKGTKIEPIKQSKA